MHIEKTFEVRRVHTTRGTENNHASLILTLACRLDRIDPYARGILLGYQDEEIRVRLMADEIVDAAEPRPMEKLWSADGQGERMRPGPTENCSECGKVIGEDPDADFYAPLAGPSRPVCGECVIKLDDQQLAAEAERDDEPAAVVEDLRDDLHEHDTITVLVDPETLDIVSVSGPDEEPIGDGAMPERPADVEPVTTPTRRRR